MIKPNDEDLYKVLERLKINGYFSIHTMNGDEVFYAEKLVEMKLATKSSSSQNTFYYYGVHRDFYRKDGQRQKFEE